ncbi:hypothetical protein EZ428_11825 [Pedobacter frigiditerrae]|uniref:Uncharacterized protein n=1 Tax=Pedobacter frigiditerrae TaxID=2530452 RepID=A0A4R0MYI8_9SPHI|nr:hypothetical protein [Pedobacter frigiditerrae]TCC92401.1 hypothetical protein EZ428_11825 [Pedobacter frigiditerrae]
MKTYPRKEIQTFIDALHKSDKALQAIYESTRSIRFIIVPDYTVLFFNKKARDEFPSVFGIEIIIGMNFSNHFKKNTFIDSLDLHFQKSLTGEHIITENLVGSGNNKLWYKIDFHPLIIDGTTIAVSISIRNINDKKIKDLRIKEQNALLSDIVFSLCHSVRGPVATNLGLLSLLDRQKLSEKNKEIVRYLEISTKNLDKILTKVVGDINNINLSE